MRLHRSAPSSLCYATCLRKHFNGINSLSFARFNPTESFLGNLSPLPFQFSIMFVEALVRADCVLSSLHVDFHYLLTRLLPCSICQTKGNVYAQMQVTRVDQSEDLS